MLDLDSVIVPVNTVMIDGQKISGGAGAVRWGAVFYHGSILVSTDLEMVWKVLRQEQPSADTRLVQSTRVAVTSIKKELGADMSIDRVKSALSKAFEETFDARLTFMPATRQEQQAVSGLVREKYGADEWNLKM